MPSKKTPKQSPALIAPPTFTPTREEIALLKEFRVLDDSTQKSIRRFISASIRDGAVRNIKPSLRLVGGAV